MMILEKRKKGKHNFFNRKRGGVMSIGEYLKSIFSLEGKTILISGATGGSSASVRAISQSETPGTEVAAGTVVRVQFSDSSVRD